MPGTCGLVSSQQFFDEIAETVLPLLNTKIDGIGFTFSYPIHITEETDGILLAFSKEINAPEVIGKKIGSELREALYRKGNKYSGPIVMLNDTAAALLSGIVSIPADGVGNTGNFNGGPVIGFILGTGFNTAYTESRIPKINFESRNAPQIVVCESGNYKIEGRGKLDIEYDSTTKNPGTYTLEKAASGAYLGPLTLHILKQAVRDNVIKFKKSDEFLAMRSLDTKALNEFICSPFKAEGPLAPLFNPDETGAVAAFQYIASLITERGALFSAAVLAATIARIDPPYEPYRPVRIAVEGTTYLIYRGMRRAVDSWLHQMLIRGKPRPYIISPVEHASLFGAAVAAVSKIKT
jgi:hexokinase